MWLKSKSGLNAVDMKQLWHRFVLWFFPSTLEEYYASREVYRREIKVYRRQPQYVIGVVCVFVPLLILLWSELLTWPWKLIVVPITFGVLCLLDSVAEHYCLILLRRSRECGGTKG